MNKRDCAPIYQIKVRGHLKNGWSDWFGNMALHLEADGNTILEGPILDQAALYGILKKINQLGLQLISINRMEATEGSISEKEDHHSPD